MKRTARQLLREVTQLKKKFASDKDNLLSLLGSALSKDIIMGLTLHEDLPNSPLSDREVAKALKGNSLFRRSDVFYMGNSIGWKVVKLHPNPAYWGWIEELNITGDIPEEVEVLSNLRRLTLYGKYRTIPSELLKTNIQELAIKGVIEDITPAKRMRRLKHLDLRSVKNVVPSIWSDELQGVTVRFPRGFPEDDFDTIIW